MSCCPPHPLLCMCSVAWFRFKFNFASRPDDNPKFKKKLKHTPEPNRRYSMGCINTLPFDSLTRSQWANVTSFDHLLKDPILLEKFKQFTIKEHSADLLFFWLDVDAYNKKSKPEEAHRIYITYLKSGAVYEIDISERDREEIKRNLEAHKYMDIFRKPQTDAFRALSVDSFLRFCVWVEELLGIPPHSHSSSTSTRRESTLSTSSSATFSTSSFTSSTTPFSNGSTTTCSPLESPSTSPRRVSLATKPPLPLPPSPTINAHYTKTELQGTPSHSSVSFLLVTTSS